MADSSRIDDLRRRVQKDPASIAFAQLAEECRRAGLYEEAVDVCRAGLRLHPGYLSARVTLGRALIEINELDAALADLELVLRSAPENLAAIRGLAEIHHRRGALPQALQQYRAALALARNDPDLQQTVDELAYQLEPPPPPESADGMSFEQVENEFLKQTPSPDAEVEPAPAEQAAPPEIIPASAEQAAPPEGIPASAEQAPPPEVMSASAEQAAPPEVIPASAALVEAPPASVAQAAPPWAAAEGAPDDHIDALEPDEDLAARGQALQVLAVLEQWLDAIHVSRTQPRA